jgi:hypothetical protein
LAQSVTATPIRRLLRWRRNQHKKLRRLKFAHALLQRLLRVDEDHARVVLEKQRAFKCRQSRLELGCVSAIDSRGQTIWIADAHRDDGKRFVVHADEKLTAFLELESANSGVRVSCLTGWRNFLQTARL